MELRSYQKDAINNLWGWLKNHPRQNPVLVAPTGSGKSVLIAEVIKEAIKHKDSKGRPIRVIVLAHVMELLEQEADKLSKYGIDYGIYSASLNSREADKQVIIAGIQSVYRRPEELGFFHLILIDEAHRVPAIEEGQYRQFIDGIRKINEKAIAIGFTATPYRTGSGYIFGEDRIFDGICYEIDVKELIHNGYLSPLTMKGWKGDDKVNFDILPSRAGDFVEEEVDKIITEEELVNAYCSDLVERTKERNSVLIFSVNVHHANTIYKSLAQKTDERIEIITGATSNNDRAQTIEDFKNGSLKYLINVNVLTTGFDAPNCDCVVLLRPTKSAGLYVQMIGRGLRLAPNKTDCLILDYGGNVLRHGPIDSVYVGVGHESRKEPNKNRKQHRTHKKCPACQSFIRIHETKCPICDFEYQEQRLSTEAGDGKLLSNGTETTEYVVKRTTYLPWDSKKHVGKKLLRVRYECESEKGTIPPFFSDWLSPEADGWQRKQFVDWWLARAPKYSEPPLTAEGAAMKAQYSDFKQADRIAVTFREGEKYPSRIQVLTLRDQNETDKGNFCQDCCHWSGEWCAYKRLQGVKGFQSACDDYAEYSEDDIPF